MLLRMLPGEGHDLPCRDDGLIRAGLRGLNRDDGELDKSGRRGVLGESEVHAVAVVSEFPCDNVESNELW